jgi:hypothetical protein
MICPNCHRKYEDKQLFCAVCASRLVKEDSDLAKNPKMSLSFFKPISIVLLVCGFLCFCGFIPSFFIQNKLFFYLSFFLSFFSFLLVIIFCSIQIRWFRNQPGGIGLLHLEKGSGLYLGLKVASIVGMFFLISFMLVFQILLLVL